MTAAAAEGSPVLLTHSAGPGRNGLFYRAVQSTATPLLTGDTEDTPEMRALKNIDVAFLCMNLPFTMDLQQAASAVREFKPKVVFPYHFYSSRQFNIQDSVAFKKLVGADPRIEVRLRSWYPRFAP